MALFSEWSEALEDALAEPFPRDVIQQKQKGGTKIDFVAWHFYARKLNGLVGGGWSIGTPVTLESGGKLIVGLPVTIFGTTRINFGSEDEDKDDYGDAATNAWAQAFKRTLALFGMGLDMYDKRRAPSDTPAGQQSPEPVVRTYQNDGAVPPCPKCGGRCWDNRVGKRNPKAPDFKCRDKDCDGAIWLKQPALQTAEREPGSDDS